VISNVCVVCCEEKRFLSFVLIHISSCAVPNTQHQIRLTSRTPRDTECSAVCRIAKIVCVTNTES